jgi:zinc protease
MVLLVRENHATPSVVLSGFLTVGAYDEQPEQAGLADFTASALTHGTENRTFEEIYSQVESVGASLGISGGTYTTGFGARSLAEDLGLVLDVLADALRRPTFPPDQVEKLRGEILADLAERAHDTRRMANLTFHELAYPEGHPYAVSSIGYPDTIDAIDRDDLLAFHAGGYGGSGLVMAVVGAVERDGVLAQVEDVFGDWEGRMYRRDPLPKVPRIEQVRRRSVAIPGKAQSDIVLGYPGPSRLDPDFLDARLCNTVLGVFGLMGRLGERVRDEEGLAYYSYSHLSGGPGPGPWRVVAGVNPVDVDRALDSVRAEIRRMCEEPVSAEELADSQAYVTGSMPLQLETNGGVASAILTMERYGLGLDYLQRYKGLIDEITPEGVQAAAQRWLDADAYALGIAGPPDS